MKDTMIMEMDSDHWVIPSNLLGDLMVRFEDNSNTISTGRNLPWHGDGIREITNTLNKIKDANAALYIFCRDRNREVVFNGVAYQDFSFEVKKYSHRDELSIFIRGRRVKGLYNTDITDAARKTVQKEINNLFYDNFDKLAESCRDVAIDRYKKNTSESLKEAAKNIEATQDFLKGLDA